jgi:FdhD protein
MFMYLDNPYYESGIQGDNLMGIVEKAKIIRWQNGRAESREDPVAVESLLKVSINKDLDFNVTVTPEDIREFVYGNLITEGVIRKPSEIKSFQEMKRKNLMEVEIELENAQQGRNYGFLWNYNILASDCGNIPIPATLEEDLDKIHHRFKLDASKLTQILANIKESIGLYRDTGAFHYAILFTPELELDLSCFDISRHNAIDKAVGKAILNGIQPEERILFTTGRITSNAILKCIRARIPFILSRGACFHDAAQLAREYDLGVVGFLRSTRFNVYSGEDHIEFEN